MPRMNLIGQHLAAATAALSVTAASAQAQVGEVLWKFDLSNVSGAFITVGDDGTIYTGDWERLWAINPDGSVKWTFEEAAGGPTGLSGQPVDILPDGRIVASAGHTIWALHPDTGTVDWSFSWDGGFNNQIDNGPSVGPDGNIYATTAVNDGLGLGAFSLTPDGELRWQDESDPPLIILNASHNQRVRFTESRMVFGFMWTVGALRVLAYDFEGDQTNHIDYTCVGSPNTDPLHVFMAGVCGVQSIDLETDSIEWSVDFGPVNMPPVVSNEGVVYSGNWHGVVGAINPQGQMLWTSPDVQLQRTLGVSEENGMFLYVGEVFGQPNWLGAIDNSSGQPLWQIPFENVGGHNELGWSNEAAFSPDGSVAYFTTRFTSNGAPGRLWAVRIADATTNAPVDFNAFRGFHDSGDLNSLLESDDNRLCYEPGIVLNQDEAPITLDFFGTLPNDSPASLEVTIESSANTVGLELTISFWNYNTNSWDIVGVEEQTFAADTVRTFAGVPADHVEPGTGEVRTRYEVRQAGIVFLFPWTDCIDHVFWTTSN